MALFLENFDNPNFITFKLFFIQIKEVQYLVDTVIDSGYMQ